MFNTLESIEKLKRTGMAQIDFGTRDTPLSVNFEDVDRIRQEKERQRHTFLENHRKKKTSKEERLQ